jgi:hypothetical protein
MEEITVIILDNELTPFVSGKPEDIAKKLSAGGFVALDSVDGTRAYINAAKVSCVAAYRGEEAAEK